VGESRSLADWRRWAVAGLRLVGGDSRPGSRLVAVAVGSRLRQVGEGRSWWRGSMYWVGSQVGLEEVVRACRVLDRNPLRKGRVQLHSLRYVSQVPL